jgi:hypothetical protein
LDGELSHSGQDVADLIHTSFCCLQHVISSLYVTVGLLHTPHLVVHPLTDSQAGRIVGRFIDA